MDIYYGLLLDLPAPLFYAVGGVLRPAINYYHIVERDGACQDVLRAFGVEFHLCGHLMEGLAVDVEQELVSRHVIAKLNFPLELIVLNAQWEQTRLGQILATEAYTKNKFRSCGGR